MLPERIAADLALPESFIRSLGKSASHEYKTYQIAKRSGGFRKIHHPSKRLKAVQRWLVANVISSLPVHDAARAYREGHSIFENAEAHARSRFLLRMDLKDFFPSIKKADVKKYIGDRLRLFLGWICEDIELFCHLVCRKSALTIGAPTSPALSNVICYDMDVQLNTLCANNGVTYTRYADDLFFSTSQPNVLRGLEKDVLRIISKLEMPKELAVNASKTRHSSKRGTRRVTGIILGSDGRPHVGRKLKRRIRALIHKFASLDASTRASLAGTLAYVIGFDPQFENSLIMKYGPSAVRKAMTMPLVGK